VQNNWRLDHLGCMVKDVNKAVILYLELGYDVQVRNVPGMPTIGLVRKGGGITIQLHTPEASIVSKGDVWFKNHGEGINHIGFAVDNIEEAVAEMKKKGYTLLGDIGFTPNGPCAFIETRGPGDIVIELMQVTVPWWW
jgi:methylmalonyl-CoA/ethylmalonyl-CoA epimerase